MAWHKTRTSWLNKLCKALLKRLKRGARRCLAYVSEYCPEACKELDLEGKVTEEFMDPAYLPVVRGNVRELDRNGKKMAKDETKKRKGLKALVVD